MVSIVLKEEPSGFSMLRPPRPTMLTTWIKRHVHIRCTVRWSEYPRERKNGQTLQDGLEKVNLQCSKNIMNLTFALEKKLDHHWIIMKIRYSLDNHWAKMIRTKHEEMERSRKLCGWEPPDQEPGG